MKYSFFVVCLFSRRKVHCVSILLDKRFSTLRREEDSLGTKPTPVISAEKPVSLPCFASVNV